MQFSESPQLRVQGGRVLTLGSGFSNEASSTILSLGCCASETIETYAEVEYLTLCGKQTPNISS